MVHVPKFPVFFLDESKIKLKSKNLKTDLKTIVHGAFPSGGDSLDGKGWGCGEHGHWAT